MLLKIFNFSCIFMATGFGVGLAAYGSADFLRNQRILNLRANWSGSGFFGTVVGLILVWLGFPLNGWSGFLCLLAISLAAIPVTGYVSDLYGTKDDQRIVLDEVVGLLWGLVFLPWPAMDSSLKIFVLLSGFALFRLFDVLKIPSSKVQDLPGGYGIVLDDILSGLLCNGILQFLVRWYLSCNPSI